MLRSMRLLGNPAGQLGLADAPLAADAEARQRAGQQQGAHGGDADLEAGGSLGGREGHWRHRIDTGPPSAAVRLSDR
jgi:hypothetical protein